MIRYYICNLEKGQDFSVENVTFQRVKDYEKRIQILKDEHRDQLTFCAIVSDRRLSQPSMFFTGDNGTSVDDMMILLSLAQSRNIYYPKAEDIVDTGTTMWGMPLGGNRKAWGVELIMEHEIEGFLKTSLRQIREIKWLDKTGFIPAVFWWFESIYAGRPLETKFVSAFVALEVLANAYCGEHKISTILLKGRFKEIVKPVVSEALSQIEKTELPNKWKELLIKKIPELNLLPIRNKISKLRDDDAYRWNFMNGSLIKDWTNIRNKYMHEGSTRSLETMSNKERATRYFQLIHSVQIALIDLLGFGNFARRQYIISEIKKPLRKTYKVSGPFPIPSCCNKEE